MRVCRAQRVLLVLGTLLLLGAAPREAAERKGDSDFWSDIADPGRKKFQVALRRGRTIFEGAERMRQLQLRARSFEDALAAFQEATRHSPRNPEGHFWIGKALYQLDRWKETAAAFAKVRQLKPDFGDDYSISFKLGIVYSKLGNFEAAVGEYNRAERIIASRGEVFGDARVARATMHGNAAEALMALGRLDEAIQRYNESLALQPGYTLGLWGLAVAFDRDEQISKSREALARVLASDPTMRQLTSDGVFFIPAGDVHYYFALGHTTKGDGAAAKREWEAFLAAVPQSQWAYRARDHLTQLGVAQKPATKAKRLAPAPSGGTSDGDAATPAQDQMAMRQRVQSHLYRIRDCYQKELKQKAQLAGQLRLSFTVNKEGKVQDAKVVSSALKRPTLHTCVLGVVKGIYFSRPSSGEPVKIVYPLEFKAGP